MAAPIYNVFVGGEIGLLKGVNINKSSWENLNSIEFAKKENEICALCWENENETKVLAGLKCQKIFSYDTIQKEFVEEFCVDMGKGRLRNIAKINGRLSTAVSFGTVRLWEDQENYEEIQAGNDLHFMANNEANSTFATGGKENDLKIWNWENPNNPVFQAKNVRNDWLNLRVPVWVLGAQFTSNEKIVSCTGYHQVRVYDPKVQRRPVLDMTFGEQPITTISLTHQKEHQVVVGNTSGSMGLLDIRKGSTVQVYKGFAGGIRHIQCHKSLPLIASCGLDRFLRIHDLNSKELKYKIYLKSRLNCLLFPKKFNIDEDVKEQVDVVTASDKVADEEIYDDDLEDVWGKMEVVKTKTKHKTETQEKMSAKITKKQKIDISGQNSVKAVKRKSKQVIVIEDPDLVCSDQGEVVKGKRKAAKTADTFSPVKTRKRTALAKTDDQVPSGVGRRKKKK